MTGPAELQPDLLPDAPAPDALDEGAADRRTRLLVPGLLAALVGVTLLLPAPVLPVLAVRTIPDRSIAAPVLDAGTASLASAFATPVELAVGEARIPLPPALLADLGGVALETGRLPSIRIDEPALAELLGPELLASLNREARDAHYAVDADAGTGITGVVADQSERHFDLASAAVVASRGLNALAAGRTRDRVIALPLAETQAALRASLLEAALPRLTLLGAQSIRYLPSISNAYAQNILVPGRAFAGQVILPGETFDFWERIGPVTREAGYRQGGAFLGGVIHVTGAFAGGICATATGLYAAAVRAGLPIEARKPHHSYLPAYPLGLDATVWKAGRNTVTLRFRNDTEGPLAIVFRQRPGFLRVELYGIADGRTVELATGPFEGVRYGSSGRAGGRVTVTRVVRNADGSIRLDERIRSSYSPS